MNHPDPLASLYAPPQAALADKAAQPPEGSMRLEYELHMRDLLRFRLLHFIASRRFHVIAACWALGMVAFAWSGSLLENPGGYLGCALVAYVCFLACLLAMQVVGTYLQRKNNFLTHHACELREDGFYDETAYFRGIHYWKGIARVTQRPGFVAIYVQSQAAYIVPDRAFAGETQRSRFLDMAARRAAAAKQA